MSDEQERSVGLLPLEKRGFPAADDSADARRRCHAAAPPTTPRPAGWRSGPIPNSVRKVSGRPSAPVAPTSDPVGASALPPSGSEHDGRAAAAGGSESMPRSARNCELVLFRRFVQPLPELRQHRRVRRQTPRDPDRRRLGTPGRRVGRPFAQQGRRAASAASRRQSGAFIVILGPPPRGRRGRRGCRRCSSLGRGSRSRCRPGCSHACGSATSTRSTSDPRLPPDECVFDPRPEQRQRGRRDRLEHERPDARRRSRGA